MTPTQLRGFLSDNKLTQAEAARQVHVSTRTMQNWLAGTNKIKPAAWELLQLKFPSLPKGGK